MNIYEFSKKYLENQTRQRWPKINILELSIYNEPNIYGWKKYFDVTRGHETKNDLLNLFALILQNRQKLPYLINYEKNYDHLKNMTHNFDPIYVSNLTKSQLLNNLSSMIGFSNNNSSWNDYCEGLIQSAKFLNKFNDFNAFKNYVDNNNSGAINALQSIRGIGPALAYNYLKEAGFEQFGKPDLHLLPVIQIIYPDVNVNNFNTYLQDIANRAGTTPYILDRIIWLICSGNYFVHEKRGGKGVRSLRKNFISALSTAIKDGVVVL